LGFVNDQGFVSTKYFDSVPAYEAGWAQLEVDYEDYLEEYGEDEEWTGASACKRRAERSQDIVGRKVRSHWGDVGEIVEVEPYSPAMTNTLVLIEKSDYKEPGTKVWYALSDLRSIDGLGPLSSLKQLRSARKAWYPKKLVRRRTAAFMMPVVEHGTWIHVDGPMGGETIPADLVGLEEVRELEKEVMRHDAGEVSVEGTGLRDYLENDTIYEIEVVDGYGARMSAPGYMDATEWAVFDNEEEAWDYLWEDYGPDLYSIVEGTKELIREDEDVEDKRVVEEALEEFVGNEGFPPYVIGDDIYDEVHKELNRGGTRGAGARRRKAQEDEEYPYPSDEEFRTGAIIVGDDYGDKEVFQVTLGGRDVGEFSDFNKAFNALVRKTGRSQDNWPYIIYIPAGRYPHMNVILLDFEGNELADWT
jgi:hypothetical protein